MADKVILVLSALFIARSGYLLEVAATAFVFSLASVIVKGFDNVKHNQSGN